MIKPCFVSIQGVFLSESKAIKDLCVLFFVKFFFFFGLCRVRTCRNLPLRGSEITLTFERDARNRYVHVKTTTKFRSLRSKVGFAN